MKKTSKRIPHSSYNPMAKKIGVNALFLKNPVTGVAKRALSFYSRIPQHYPGVVITFFTPHPLSPHTLNDLKNYGIDLTRSEFRTVITPIWGLKFPVFREICEWWWLHFRIPLLCHRHHITLYEVPWGRGIPLLFPYRIMSWWSIKKPITILTIHDLIPLKPLSPNYIGGWGGWFKGYLAERYRRLQSLSFKRRMAAELQAANKAVVVSPQVYRDILYHFPKVPPNKIVIIPNGINGINKIERRGREASSNQNKLNGHRKSKKDRVKCWDYIRQHGIANSVGQALLQQTSTQFLFYLGGFSPRKNLLGLLTALASCPTQTNKKSKDSPFHALVIAGKENHYFRQAFLPVIENHPFPIIRLGYLPEKELPAFYRQANCTCYLSLNEGFGMPPLEALAEGGRVMIDQNLPINTGMDGKSFIVEKLKHLFKNQSYEIEHWWQDRVIVVDGNNINQVTLALSRIITHSQKNFPMKSTTPYLSRKGSPFIWENLAKEFSDFIIQSMNELQ